MGGLLLIVWFGVCFFVFFGDVILGVDVVVVVVLLFGMGVGDGLFIEGLLLLGLGMMRVRCVFW